MSLPRFFVDDRAAVGEAIALPPDEAHHAARVLRLRAGDRIIACDGSGREFITELTEVAPNRVAGRVEQAQSGACEPPLHLTLVQGIPKGDKMEMVIQKGTEVGVSEFVPLITARTQVALDARKALNRTERWRRVALEAAKQCGRAVLPQVRPPQTLREFAARWPGDLLLVPWEEAGAEVAAGYVLRALPREVDRVAVVIGPEGGLEAAEVAALTEVGGRTVSLGPRILRTETAGMVVAALIMYELGDMGGLRGSPRQGNA